MLLETGIWNSGDGGIQFKGSFNFKNIVGSWLGCS